MKGESKNRVPLKWLQYLPRMEEVVDAWRITSFSVVVASRSPVAIFAGPSVGMVALIIGSDGPETSLINNKELVQQTTVLLKLRTVS